MTWSAFTLLTRFLLSVCQLCLIDLFDYISYTFQYSIRIENKKKSDIFNHLITELMTPFFPSFFHRSFYSLPGQFFCCSITGSNYQFVRRWGKTIRSAKKYWFLIWNRLTMPYYFVYRIKLCAFECLNKKNIVIKVR